MKKKVAVCLHGCISNKYQDFNNGYTNRYTKHEYVKYDDNINNFVNYYACYKSIKKHIIDCNPDYDIDVYIHMWYQNEQMKQELINMYNPVKYVFADNKDYMNMFEEKCVSIGDEKKSFKGNISRLYSICESFKLCLDSNIDYDLMISYRPDLLLWKNMDFNTYDRNCVTKNGKGFGDFHFVMSKEHGILFSQFYNKCNNSHYKAHTALYNIYVKKDLNLEFKGDNILPNHHQEVLRKIKKHSIRLNRITDKTLLEFGLDKEELINEYDKPKKK